MGPDDFNLGVCYSGHFTKTIFQNSHSVLKIHSSRRTYSIFSVLAVSYGILSNLDKHKRLLLSLIAY